MKFIISYTNSDPNSIYVQHSVQLTHPETEEEKVAVDIAAKFFSGDVSFLDEFNKEIVAVRKTEEGLEVFIDEERITYQIK